MSKKDARRQVEEGKTRDAGREQQAESMNASGGAGNEQMEEMIQRSKQREKKQEGGNKPRMRFRDKMQKWAGLSDRSAASMQERFKGDYSVKDLKKQQDKKEKEARHRSSPLAIGPDAEKTRHRKKKRGKAPAAAEELEEVGDSSINDKNRDVALPKWVIDVDQNNRLADFDDLIKGEHRKKKKGRHTSGDAEAAEQMAPEAETRKHRRPVEAEPEAAPVEAFAPMTRKKKKARAESEEDTAATEEPLPVHTPEEKEQKQAERAAARQERRAAQAAESAAAEPEAMPMQRKKKRRQVDDDD